MKVSAVGCLFLLAVAVFQLKSATAVLCYACTSIPPENAVNEYGNLTYPGGYIYTDIENREQTIPWKEFFQGENCDYTKNLDKGVKKVNCLFGCLKGVAILSKKHKLERTYRQCAYPYGDPGRYAWGGKIKRAGASDGTNNYFYYCKDSTPTWACNGATSPTAPAAVLLSAVTAWLMLL